MGGEGRGVEGREGGRIEARSVTQVSFSTPHHGNHSTHKSEVCQVLWVNGGGRVYLQHVIVLSRILKQAVHGVEHLVGELEEPLPGGAAVVQALLPAEHDVQPPAQVLRLEPHYLEWRNG